MQAIFRQVAISPGYAMGSLFCVHTFKAQEAPSTHQGSSEQEWEIFQQAQKKVIEKLKELEALTQTKAGSDAAQIFETHQLLMTDEEVVALIQEKIFKGKKSASIATQESFDFNIEVLSQSDSDYLKERVSDLKDLKQQTIDQIEGRSEIVFPTDSDFILWIKDLTPSIALKLDPKFCKGILTEDGGVTSHAAILSRTLGIPAISGITERTAKHLPKIIGMNGETGEIFDATLPVIRDELLKKIEIQNQGLQDLQQWKDCPTLTRDQKRLLLYANVASLKDAEIALAQGAEGIGLFRTEFLFMNRNEPPTEAEQVQVYQKVLSLYGKKEVILRTLDIGGDKDVPYVTDEKEANPFLGLRGIRLCLKEVALFKTQLRAMLRSNQNGNLSIMIPMVSQVHEVDSFRKILEECESELVQEGTQIFPYKVGIMIEIPAIAFAMNSLKGKIDFASVGTNDLMQYSLAVDRMNPKLEHLYDPFHPGFLRLMELIAKEAKENGISIGICGELGGHGKLTPEWIRMGYEKLSMVPSLILSRRAQIAEF